MLVIGHEAKRYINQSLDHTNHRNCHLRLGFKVVNNKARDEVGKDSADNGAHRDDVVEELILITINPKVILLEKGDYCCFPKSKTGSNQYHDSRIICKEHLEPKAVFLK